MRITLFWSVSEHSAQGKSETLFKIFCRKHEILVLWETAQVFTCKSLLRGTGIEGKVTGEFYIQHCNTPNDLCKPTWSVWLFLKKFRSSFSSSDQAANPLWWLTVFPSFYQRGKCNYCHCLLNTASTTSQVMDCPVDSLFLITMLGRNAALFLCALGNMGKVQKENNSECLRRWECDITVSENLYCVSE